MILMGAPGAGKGTQAKLLEARLGVPHISSGDLLRAAVKRKTRLGVQAKRFMDRGELVPDDVLLSAIEERMSETDCQRGFILDGFPRTIGQVAALDAILSRQGAKVDRVVSIRVPIDDLVKRMSGRRTCRDCGAMYHIIFDPPRNSGLCNKCSGELFQRDDDQEDTIRARLEVHTRQTAPVLATYQAQGLVSEVDGFGSQDDVLKRILDTGLSNG